MKQFISFVVVIVLFCSCGANINELKRGIVETEQKGLPLTIQEMEGVYSITIDSLVIINNVSPYYGYLVTTWDVNEKHDNSMQEFSKTREWYSYKRVTKQLNVEVSDISVKGRKYSWRTNWGRAYLQAIRDDSFNDLSMEDYRYVSRGNDEDNPVVDNSATDMLISGDYEGDMYMPTDLGLEGEMDF